MTKKEECAKQIKSQPVLAHSLQRPEFKKNVAAIIAGVALALAILFAALGNIHNSYNIIVLAASLIWLLMALPNLQLGLAAALCFAVPLFIPFGNSDFTLPKISLTVIFVSLILIIWAVSSIRKRETSLQLTALILPGALLLFSALLSLLNSANVVSDLQYIFIIIFFALLGLYLTNIISNSDDFQMLAGALIASVTLSAIYGLLQYFGLITGYHGVSVGTEEMGTTLGNRNYLGGCIAYLFPVGLVLFLHAQRKLTRALILIALSLIFTSLIAIDSDSSWLAWILAMITFTAGLWLTGELPRLFAMRRWVLALVGLTLFSSALFLIATLIFQPTIDSKFVTINEGLTRFSRLMWIAVVPIILLLLSAYAGKLLQAVRRFWLAGSLALALLITSALIFTPAGPLLGKAITQVTTQTTVYLRAQFWLIGLEMLKEHPVIGVGIGDYKEEYLPYKAIFFETAASKIFRESVPYEIPAAHAHNDYVQIGAEMGILGLLSLTLFIFAVGWRALEVLRNRASPEALWLSIALIAGIIAAMLDALFSFPLHLPANSLIIVFLIAALHSGLVGKPFNIIRLKALGTSLLGSALIVLALIGSIFAYREWQADINFFAGQSLLAKGDARGEQLMLNSVALSIAPGQVLYKLGIWYYNQGNLSKAQNYLERSLTSFGRMDSYFLLAIIHTQLGQFESAKEYLNRLLTFNPPASFKDERVPYLQALILNEQGQVEEAISILEALVAREYNPWTVRLDLAEIYLNQGDMQRAREYAEEDLLHIEQELKSLGPRAKPSYRAELLAVQKRAQDFLKRLPNN